MTPRTKMLQLIVLTLVSGFAFYGSRGLYDTTEGRYAEVAREMLQSDNFLEPTLEGKPHWTKPPLTYWSVAAGLRLAGRNAWGARLAGAMAFCLTTLAITWMGRRLGNEETGFLAGLIYLSSPLPAASASVLSSDTLLTLWEVVAVMAYVGAWRAPNDRVAKVWIRLMWCGFGLAFLTKGPPGILPVLPLVVFHMVGRVRGRFFDLVGVLIFAVVGLWWFIVVIARHPELLSYFVRGEIIDRNLTSHHRRNPQWYRSIVVYVPTILAGVVPWLAHGFLMLREHARALPDVVRARGSRTQFLLLWFALPLSVLALSRSRLPLYALPYFAPIVLGLAIALERSKKRRGRQVVALACTMVFVWSAVKFAAREYPYRRNAERLYNAARDVGGDHAEYVLVQEMELHGLQFYFDGRLKMLPFAADGGHHPFEDYVRSLPSGAAAPVLIVGSGNVERVVSTVEKANIVWVQSGVFEKFALIRLDV